MAAADPIESGRETQRDIEKGIGRDIERYRETERARKRG